MSYADDYPVEAMLREELAQVRKERDAMSARLLRYVDLALNPPLFADPSWCPHCGKHIGLLPPHPPAAPTVTPTVTHNATNPHQ